nr:MFS transporter [Rhizobium leguminosarum]
MARELSLAERPRCTRGSFIAGTSIVLLAPRRQRLGHHHPECPSWPTLRTSDFFAFVGAIFRLTITRATVSRIVGWGFIAHHDTWAHLFMLPFHLIKVHGYSTTMAGAAFLPFSVILGLGSRPAGGISSKTGPRLPMVAGPTLTALGFALLALSSGQAGYWLGYLPGLVLIGVGMTITIPSLTTIVFDSAPKEDSGAASGINNAAARSGGLIAVAALGIAFGSSDMASLAPADISSAYATVMSAAAASAILSALLAWLMIERVDGGPKKVGR